MGKYTNLVGQKFGRLTVMEENGRNKNGGVLWLCKCDCENGKNVIAVSADLKNGHTQSCGCLNKEKDAINAREKAEIECLENLDIKNRKEDV